MRPMVFRVRFESDTAKGSFPLRDFADRPPAELHKLAAGEVERRVKVGLYPASAKVVSITAATKAGPAVVWPESEAPAPLPAEAPAS